jgi:hypothetical protein
MTPDDDRALDDYRALDDGHAFYEGLVTRNAGVVSPEEQRALREATVLVAGCGSIGGAAVEPLARLGVRNFLLADPGEFELSNLNRQNAGVDDIGRNKAVVAAERVKAVNPHAQVTVFPDGVGPHTVRELTENCSVIIDGVDVTTSEGWRAKFLLHQEAVRRRLPLVTGWDMAGAQYVRHYDYRRVHEPFEGRITQRDLDRAGNWELLRRAVPLRRVPVEMLAEIRAHHATADYSFPQIAYTATAFGVVSARMAARLVAGGRVPREVFLDVHQMTRPRGERWLTRLRRPVELAALVPPLVRLLRRPDAF